MIKLRHLTLAGLAAWSISPAFAACEYPQEVGIPDGSKASEEEMIAGQKLVKSYIANVEAYLKCLDEEATALGDAETDDQKQMHIKRHNAAVDAMEQLAASFNKEIQAFKARPE